MRLGESCRLRRISVLPTDWSSQFWNALRLLVTSTGRLEPWSRITRRLRWWKNRLQPRPRRCHLAPSPWILSCCTPSWSLARAAIILSFAKWIRWPTYSPRWRAFVMSVVKIWMYACRILRSIRMNSRYLRKGVRESYSSLKAWELLSNHHSRTVSRNQILYRQLSSARTVYDLHDLSLCTIYLFKLSIVSAASVLSNGWARDT